MIRISAHCLVKNEARFIWYSLSSIVNWIDRLRIVDVGSSDDTVKIINEFIRTYEGPTEIFFSEETVEGRFDEKKFRDEMFSEDVFNNKSSNSSNIDWILIVDGDEIWWNDSIKKVTEKIRNEANKIESIIVPVYNLVGDIFHYQEMIAGKYKFKGLPKGHYNLRAYNKNIPGIHSKGEYGVFGWFDENNKMIQERNASKVIFIDAPYIHATHLQRSSIKDKDLEVYKRKQKNKHEIGKSFPKDFYYPEAFFKSRPSFVKDIWKTMDSQFILQSYFETPLRWVKRRINL